MDLPVLLAAQNHTGGMAYMRANAPVVVPYFILLCTATASGTIGNILIIGAVLINKDLRHVGNIFICNLAVADLCVSSFVDIFNIISVVEGEIWFRRRPGVCDMVGIICLTACFCSLYSIGTVSFNRYIHICRNDLYQTIFTPRKTIAMVGILWFISLMLESPNFLGWGGHTYDKKTLTCLWDRTASYSYTLFMAIVGITIPLVVIAICYWKIFMHVRASKRRIANINAIAQGNKTLRMSGNRADSMKLARTLFIIFVVFVICWAPYAIVIVADRYDTFAQEIHMFAILMAHVNSSCNSILYGVTNRSFRHGYMRLLGMHRCCPKVFMNHSKAGPNRNDNSVSYTNKTAESNIGIDD